MSKFAQIAVDIVENGKIIVPLDIFSLTSGEKMSDRATRLNIALKRFFNEEYDDACREEFISGVMELVAKHLSVTRENPYAISQQPNLRVFYRRDMSDVVSRDDLLRIISNYISCGKKAQAGELTEKIKNYVLRAVDSSFDRDEVLKKLESSEVCSSLIKDSPMSVNETVGKVIVTELAREHVKENKDKFYVVTKIENTIEFRKFLDSLLSGSYYPDVPVWVTPFQEDNFRLKGELGKNLADFFLNDRHVEEVNLPLLAWLAKFMKVSPYRLFRKSYKATETEFYSDMVNEFKVNEMSSPSSFGEPSPAFVTCLATIRFIDFVFMFVDASDRLESNDVIYSFDLDGGVVGVFDPIQGSGAFMDIPVRDVTLDVTPNMIIPPNNGEFLGAVRVDIQKYCGELFSPSFVYPFGTRA